MKNYITDDVQPVFKGGSAPQAGILRLFGCFCKKTVPFTSRMGYNKCTNTSVWRKL